MIPFRKFELVKQEAEIPFIRMFDSEYWNRIKEAINKKNGVPIVLTNFINDTQKDEIKIVGNFYSVDLHQIGSIPFGWLCWYTEQWNAAGIMEKFTGKKKNNLNFHNLCITGYIHVKRVEK